jgi:hypothetical protein
MAKKTATDTEMLARLIKEETESIRSVMVTKDDLKIFATKDDLKRFATKDDLKRFATKDDLKRFATKDDLKRFATKDDLDAFATKSEVHSIVDTATEKILDELRPIARAVDKDAVTILNHEKRITKIERRLVRT